MINGNEKNWVEDGGQGTGTVGRRKLLESSQCYELCITSINVLGDEVLDDFGDFSCLSILLLLSIAGIDCGSFPALENII